MWTEAFVMWSSGYLLWLLWWIAHFKQPVLRLWNNRLTIIFDAIQVDSSIQNHTIFIQDQTIWARKDDSEGIKTHSNQTTYVEEATLKPIMETFPHNKQNRVAYILLHMLMCRPETLPPSTWVMEWSKCWLWFLWQPLSFGMRYCCMCTKQTETCFL